VARMLVKGVDLAIDLGLSRRSTWFADECLL